MKFFFIFLVLPFGLFSQDVHYAQFYLSPLTTNPANTGKHDGDWRVAGNYRNQWRSLGRPFVSASFSYDQNFFVFNEQLSAGLMYMHDETGLVNLRFEKIMASAAYHKQIEKHGIHIGFQPGFVLKAADLDNTSLPSQYDRNTGGFNPDLPSGDPYAQNQMSYFDFNAGLAYDIDLGIARPEIGFSMFHLTKPEETFYNTGNTLPIRYTFTLRSDLFLHDQFYVTPYILHMSHNKASEMLLGANVTLVLHQHNSNVQGIYGGLMFRNGFNRNTDAAIAVVGLKYRHLEIGFNYDFNVSELKLATDNRGAYEISFVYTSLSTLLKKTAIPCDRY